jgi:HEAT repeat protein
MRLRDRFFGTPATMDSVQLQRAFRHGSSRLKIEICQLWAHHEVNPHLLAVLEHPVPGVRRAAARGLGWSKDPLIHSRLKDRLAKEANDTVRLALGGALIRLGEPQGSLLDKVANGPSTTLWTINGEKNANKAIGMHEGLVADRLTLEAGDRQATNREDQLKTLNTHLDQQGQEADYDTLSRMAVLAGPDFMNQIGMLHSARRIQHTLLYARGVHGAPSHIIELRAALESLSDDPGKGFARRRIAAQAIGEIGDPTCLELLYSAALRETHDFEGRPGSGLGIQNPVRNTIIWAMGEIENASAASYLVSLLDDTDGTATGGLYLPAISALHKLGPRAHIALKQPPRSEVQAKHINWLLNHL